MSPENEVGVAAPRRRPEVPRAKAEADLSLIAGCSIELPESARVLGRPTTCPACGSDDLTWGCAREVAPSQQVVHPLVWHETEWMADSYVCRECHAGWIEPDDPEPITWVRPYWRVEG